MKKIVSLMLALLLVAGVSVVAFAAGSPVQPATKFEVAVSNANSNNGTVEKVVNEDGTITLTVKLADGAKFAKWVINGDYEIVEGSLTSTTIKIKASADLKVEASYEGSNTTAEPADSTDDSANGSSVSPKTGAPVASVAVVLFAAAGVAVVSKKKLSK